MADTKNFEVPVSSFIESIKDLYLEELKKEIEVIQKENVERLEKLTAKYLTKVANNITVNVRDMAIGMEPNVVKIFINFSGKLDALRE